MDCKWCINSQCRSGNEKDCDFKTLPYEKEAIIERINEEFGLVEDALRNAKNTDKQQTKEFIRDKLVGMKVMVEVLRDDFHCQYKVKRNPLAFANLVLKARKYLE
jgi:hypothetical protein